MPRVSLRSLSVFGQPQPPLVQLPPLPSASRMPGRCHPPRRIMARTLAQARDDELDGAQFVALGDGVNVVGIRVITATPGTQSSWLTVGVAETPGPVPQLP